jgi:hypothetical protein
MRSEGHHTERCLQLNGFQYDHITELVIHQQQPESQQSHSSSSQSPHSLRPNPVERLASHSCEAGLWQDTHTSLVTIRPPASSCQLRRGGHSTTPLNPFRPRVRQEHDLRLV